VELVAHHHQLLTVHLEQIQYFLLSFLMGVVVAAKLIQPVILAAPVEVLGVEARQVRVVLETLLLQLQVKVIMVGQPPEELVVVVEAAVLLM
jgi:hypothetical protein